MRVTATLLLFIAVMASGCSRDAVQRTGYETVRNIEQQRCLEQQATSPCPKGEEYDEYQRRRKELEQQP